MKKLTLPRLDMAVDAVLANAHSEFEEHTAFARILNQYVPTPSKALVAGSEVELQGFSFDGNPSRGVTARIVAANGKTYRIAAADVEPSCGGVGADYFAVYRRWLGLTPYPQSRRAPAEPKIVQTVELVYLSPEKSTTWICRRNGSQEVKLRLTSVASAVPGQILTVDAKELDDASVKGTLRSTRIDAKALELTPLALYPRGMWDPQEHFWGDEGHVPEKWEKAQQLWGPRPQFEMEQILPGEDPDNPHSDPIIEAMDCAGKRLVGRAFRILFDLCRADLRCLDAHAHMGNLWFDSRPALAIRHYEVGVRIGELSLGDNFQGLLPWGMIDNRPFLRCLIGYGLCLWRMKQFEEAAQVFERMLWLNPTDNQGVRMLIDDVAAKRPWRDDY